MDDKAAFMQALSDILVEHRVMSREQARDLLKSFGDSTIEEFEDFLLDQGLVEKDDLLAALSKYYNVPSFDVADFFFERHFLREFPLDFLVRNEIIPVDTENNTHLIVVAAEPNRSGLESAIRGFVSYDVIFNVGIRQDIVDAAREYYDASVTEVNQDISIDEEHREAQEAEREIMTETEQEE
ncbi:MAG TPA: hypothetical protein VFF04_06480 [Candidatus Babeliales bacterium]|nr:hypothetical protein [Candidatus Babeliales bacterium]